MTSRFAFARKEFENDATRFLKATPNATVYEVLCQKELAGAVRNESQVLLDFLNSPISEREPACLKDRSLLSIDVLTEWALGTALSETVKDQWKLRQVSKNAANVLSAPCKGVQKLIKEEPSGYVRRRIRDFIDSESARDLVCAGHFHRIFETVLRNDADFGGIDGFDLKRFMAFMIENVGVNAYQQLLCHIGTDFTDLFLGEYDFRGYIVDILKGAARKVFAISSNMEKKSEEERTQCAKELTETMKAVENNRKSKQVLSQRRKEPVPLVDLSSRIDTADFVFEFSPDHMAERKAENQRLAGYTEQRHYCGLEEAKRDAYMLLGTIREMAMDNREVFLAMQDEMPVRLLLMCGIYSDPVSLVASQAFKLLKTVVYGSDPKTWMTYWEAEEEEALEEEGTIVHEMEESIWDIIDEYAQDFYFGDCLTMQMIAAFPLFWRHNYETLAETQKYLEIDRVVWVPPKGEPRSMVAGKEQGHNKEIRETEKRGVYEKKPGRTPLECYGRFLLDEPPISDAFNNEILNVLKWWINKCHRKRREFAEPVEHPDWQMEVFDMDLVLFDFLRSQFPYGRWKLVDMSILVEAVPLSPIDDYWMEIKERHHVPLNGHIIELVVLLDRSDIFQLGSRGDAGPLWVQASLPGNTQKDKDTLGELAALAGLYRDVMDMFDPEKAERAKIPMKMKMVERKGEKKVDRSTDWGVPDDEEEPAPRAEPDEDLLQTTNGGL